MKQERIIAEIYSRLNLARMEDELVTAQLIADAIGIPRNDNASRSFVSRTLASLKHQGVLEDTTPDQIRHHRYRVRRRVPEQAPRFTSARPGPGATERALEAPPGRKPPEASPFSYPGGLDALVGSLARRADVEQLARQVASLSTRVEGIAEMMAYIFTELGGK